MNNSVKFWVYTLKISNISYSVRRICSSLDCSAGEVNVVVVGDVVDVVGVADGVVVPR